MLDCEREEKQKKKEEKKEVKKEEKKRRRNPCCFMFHRGDGHMIGWFVAPHVGCTAHTFVYSH